MRDQRMASSARCDRGGEAVAVDRQRAAGRHLVRVAPPPGSASRSAASPHAAGRPRCSAASSERKELEQTSSASPSVLCASVAAHRPHLVQHDRHAAPARSARRPREPASPPPMTWMGDLRHGRHSSSLPAAMPSAESRPPSAGDRNHCRDRLFNLAATQGRLAMPIVRLIHVQVAPARPGRGRAHLEAGLRAADDQAAGLPVGRSCSSASTRRANISPIRNGRTTRPSRPIARARITRPSRSIRASCRAPRPW